ncbi:MAG: monovalent cation/H(+) antiporter subunit G [Bacillota bacterium]
MSEILISIFLLFGTFMALLGATGLLRFPDVYNRMHASGMSTTLGTTAIVIGGTIYFSVHDGLTLKLLLVIPFLFWTASAGTYMTARAAHRTGPNLAPETIRDDLQEKAGTFKQQQ